MPLIGGGASTTSLISGPDRLRRVTDWEMRAVLVLCTVSIKFKAKIEGAPFPIDGEDDTDLPLAYARMVTEVLLRAIDQTESVSV